MISEWLITSANFSEKYVCHTTQLAINNSYQNEIHNKIELMSLSGELYISMTRLFSNHIQDHSVFTELINCFSARHDK